MDPSAFLLLMAASAVNMALPGPGIILTFTRASRAGLCAAGMVSAGLLLSSLILTTAAVAILAGMMEVSQAALDGARWLGLAVIFWIALRLLLAPATADGTATRTNGTGDLFTGLPHRRLRTSSLS